MEYISKETPVMRSIGWLLMNTGKSIVMTDTIGPEESAALHTIPYEMIRNAGILGGVT